MERKEAMHRVGIVQRILPHYRIPFFRELHRQLDLVGIDMTLVYGQERPGTVPQTVSLDEPWAIRAKNTYLSLGSLELVWQPALRYLTQHDCLIIEQANRLLINHYLILRRKLLNYPRLIYWGHGANLQTPSKHSLGERLKRRLLREVDWWLAYTSLSEDIVANSGFPRSRISVVHNTIDASEIIDTCNQYSEAQLRTLKAYLGIKGDNICLYCGGLYAAKRIDFLIEAGTRIRAMVPDFELIVVGSGPDQGKIEAAAKTQKWIHFVGAHYGKERVPYFLLSKAVLMPGLVGLAIIDSFAAATPLFTTDLPIHSPEITYLVNSVNGLMTPNSVEEYSLAVVEYLRSELLQARLRKGCRQSAMTYSLTNMVKNFAFGIQQCLQDPPHTACSKTAVHHGSTS